MNKYDICQVSILQDIPVHVADLTESPIKKFKPSLSFHYPYDEVRKKSMLFPSIPDAMLQVVGKCNSIRLYNSYGGIATFTDPILMDFVKLICHLFYCAIKWK